MTQILTREHTKEESTWKLEDLYATEAQWEQEYQRVLELLADVPSFQGKLSENNTLKKCFMLEDQISLLAERLYVYANMRHHQDTTVPHYQALSEKARKINVKVNEALSFVTPELVKLSHEKLDSFIQDPALETYRFSLQEIKRLKPHVLSEPEENLLAQAGQISQAASNVFSILNNADLSFKPIIDENGNEVTLTHGNYIHFLENPNPQVRKSAFESMYDGYSSLKNTFATTLNEHIKRNMFYAQARKYPSTLEMSLASDNISVDVYDNLIHTIQDHLPLLHRYINLKKKMLKTDTLHMYDLFCPLTKKARAKIPFEQAKEWIFESLKVLGPDYIAALQKGFDDRWIDVYENSGKRSGAYSWGAYGTHPYVLMNYKDNLDSVFTLTHEMGHALHSYHSDNALPYRNAQYTIFLAEVASTLHESLLMHHLLKTTTDPEMRLNLLIYYIEQFRTTVFRQTKFAEFEKLIFDKSENGEYLTVQELSKLYYDLNVKYYGPHMHVDQAIEVEWARIPHFYTSFYVYKYATGFSAASSFAKQILTEGAPAVERYLGFLKSGGSNFSIEILKKAGVDMSTPDPIKQAMTVYEGLLEELEQLIQ